MRFNHHWLKNLVKSVIFMRCFCYFGQLLASCRKYVFSLKVDMLVEKGV